MRKKTKYRFEQMAGQGVVKLYIYDDVTAYGNFNWETLEYDEAKPVPIISGSSWRRFRKRLRLSFMSTAMAEV